MTKSGKSSNGKKNGNGHPKRGGRRSRADSMTGAKDAAVEMRKGELELQQIELKQDDFDLHYRAMRGAKEKMATAKSLYDVCAKSAKKVSADLLEAVKLALKWDGMDSEDIKREMKIRGFVLTATASPLQLTIHDTLLGEVHDVAYKRGHHAGQNGQTMANPYPEGSDLAESYTTGWRNGQGATLGLSEEQVSAAVAGSERLRSSSDPAPVH